MCQSAMTTAASGGFLTLLRYAMGLTALAFSLNLSGSESPTSEPLSQDLFSWTLPLGLCLAGALIGLGALFWNRHHLKKRLDESEQKNTTLLNHTREGIALINPELHLISINQTGKDAILQDRPLEGLCCYEAYYKTKEPCPDCPVVEAMKTHETCFAELRQPNGRLYQISATPVFSPSGDLTGVVEVFSDVSELKEQEAVILENEEHLRSVIESMGEAVVIMDKARRILSLNEAAATLSGWETHQATGSLFDEVFDIDLPASQNSKSTRSSQTINQVESKRFERCRLVSKTGREHWINGSMAPVKNVYGEVSGIVAVLLDITQTAENETRLSQARLMEVIERLAGGIAHDYNNMLTAIMGFADLMSGKLSDRPKLKEYCEHIVSTTKRASKLTQELLSFARQKPHHSQPVSVHQTIEETARALKRTIEPTIKIEVDLSASSATILGDHLELQTVLLNLGMNARDAMPEGGRLLFSTDIATLPPSWGKSNGCNIPGGRYLAIVVRDTGQGMTPEEVQHIFEPFYTTKEVGKGIGMGMAAVYGIVKAHKGAITVFSKPGAGTEFKIYLPLIPEVELALTQDSSVLPTPPAREKAGILIADDDEKIRAVACSILEEAGYQVYLARDGLETIEFYQELQTEIDLVLLDSVMPKLTGYQALERLREINPDVSVIVSSGLNQEQRIQEFLSNGAKAFVTKPYRRSELLSLVTRVLRKKMQTGEHPIRPLLENEKNQTISKEPKPKGSEPSGDGKA